jgi:hypothetical protein
LNPGRRGGKPATNCLSYGAANDYLTNIMFLDIIHCPVYFSKIFYLFFKNKQDCVLDKDRTMDNIKKYNSCTQREAGPGSQH